MQKGTEEYRKWNAAYARDYRKRNSERIRAVKKAYRLQHLEKSRAQVREYHSKHRERMRAYVKAWRVKNSEHCRGKKLKRIHGLDASEYDLMFKEQNGLCAICLLPETQVDSRNGRIVHLSVDHDHKTGRNRGLLCHSCNNMLGRVKDDPARLRAAAEYLEHFSRLTI